MMKIQIINQDYSFAVMKIKKERKKMSTKYYRF